jgi:trimeric autotransporter adhesin
VGTGSLAANTTANYNTAVGNNALTANTTGANNTCVGANSGDAITTASFNTSMGSGALGTNILSGANVAVGQDCLANHNTATAINGYNTAVGTNAGAAVTTGGNNTLIGGSAGDAITTGSSNIIIGYFSDVSSSGGSSQFVLGNGVTCVGNGNFTFGDGTSDSNIANGATSITAPSDIRLKENIQDEEVGLDFINDLRPVTFQWKKEKDIPSDMKAYKEGSEERTMNGKYNHGFIAQEVKEVIDNHNLKDGFDMWQEDEADGRQRVAPSALVPILVKAIQELSAQNDALTTRIEALEG